ncbi:MAG TPA: DUF3108 domain-containing protein [Thermoanaerobaculia bacterium]|nr:DUF3108 domain-containing protein [Thermoanaerobaculia bacterium]
MSMIRRTMIAFLLAAVSASAFAADFDQTATNVEELRYSWRLRGGIRFFAGLVFPTSGVGNLRTVFPTGQDQSIHSELLITAPNGRAGGFYAYESDMDDSGNRTLMTYHGYAWGKKSRNERTVFDYVKRLARIRKQTPEGVENKVKPLPSENETRDILTAIHYLRQNAHTITAPIQTRIFSDGKEYPVIFRPGAGRTTLTIDGRRTPVMAFEIVDAPGGKKWPGGVKVWLSADERRVPVRIEIQQSIASMQLDLQSIERVPTTATAAR